MNKIFTQIVLINLIFSPFILTQAEEQTDDTIQKSETFLEEFNMFRNVTGLGVELNYKGEVFSNFSGGMEIEVFILII